jgi:hypothetical protein
MSSTTPEKKASNKEVVVALMQPVGLPYFEETKTKEGNIVKKQYVRYHLSSSQATPIHMLT